MLSRPAIAILIGVAAIVAIGAACALFLFNDEDTNVTDGSSSAFEYKVAYYDPEGKEILRRNVAAGTVITIEGELGLNNESKRVLGWNTKSDLKGSLYLPKTKLKVDKDISLYAVMINSEMFAVILPEKQVGYSITADPMYVERGGSVILSYSILPSHIDDDLVIAVNGNPMKRNALNEIHLTEINEDQVVIVTGVFDRREHSITLPEEQRGYTLTCDVEKVHHGESYTLFYTLLPGYKETNEFGIHFNGVNTKWPVGGEVLYEDVSDNHWITVTGVEPILFNIGVGKNITVLLDGVSVTQATMEDVLTIQPADGYYLPTTFIGQITGPFTIDHKGYHIKGDVTFPSVLKITAGDNVEMNGKPAKTMFVCPLDKVKVNAASGYILPSDYSSAACALRGVTYSAQGYSFSEEVVLPSIYKVTYIIHKNVVHTTIYVIGGNIVPVPPKNPIRDGYYFAGWEISPLPVISDQLVKSKWDPMTHNVYFGPNLWILIDDNGFSSETGVTVRVKSDEEVRVCCNSGLPLPVNYTPSPFPNVIYEDDFYYIVGDISFPGVATIKYVEKGTLEGPSDLVTIGKWYALPLLPTIKKEGYFFEGWLFEGTLKKGGEYVFIEEDFYFIYPSWK